MKTVTKRDIVIDITNHTGFTQTEIKNVVETILSEISDVLAENNSIELRGFGTFYPKVRKPRPARNIHTGEVVPLQKRVVPLFRYSSNLKDLIDHGNKGSEVVPVFDTTY